MNKIDNKVFILCQDPTPYETLLSQAECEDLTLTDKPDEANILLADPPLAAKRLSEFTQLEWLQSTFAGIDALIDESLNQDYELTKVHGIFGQQISEYVIGNTLNYFRHLPRYRHQQRQQEWQPHPYQSLNEKSILILGCGSIGSHLAKVCNAFGMKTGGVNQSGIPPKNSPFKHIFHIHELDVVVKDADIIVNTLPSTPETRGMLNMKLLNQANHALLFNVGRGDALVEEDLLTAMEQGHIAHAYLDVFNQEPLSAEHPLWKHPKVSITPHIAATSFPNQVMEIFVENYKRWHDGFQLQHRVDFNKGY
ncbi:D-2-hydroxyacid dehydrogenase [Vibrio sp. SCSIO 43136]|uniref:D-2-hydroxyacid dehydrogenase n=1 Tax=Vibrio sp. SCSIO 43136 TaxID=2819101 RepID=UPI00207527CE|nr:D-2-hydroxyacid dehydrogenase [Vibrio sp. SCSIO 43136]USD65431.1 D-2-hydroxyacid dehydrogenase [Vibrio sp. SCSIO 43136]